MKFDGHNENQQLMFECASPKEKKGEQFRKNKGREAQQTTTEGKEGCAPSTWGHHCTCCRSSACLARHQGERVPLRGRIQLCLFVAAAAVVFVVVSSQATSGYEMQVDSSIFEINDFTTASPWERFEYELQELLRHWSLHNRQSKAGNVTLHEALISTLHWTNRSEQLYLSKTVFTVTHLYVKNLTNDPPIDPLSPKSQVSSSTALTDTRDSRNDLFSAGPAISRYFGLREFIIISSPNGSSELIDSQDKVKLLLSAVTCALTASSCEVPVFVQVGANRSFLYSGIATGSDFRISFDTAVIRPPPRNGALSHLNEVLDLFKEKVSSPFGQSVPASVSIRLMSEVGGDWPKRMLYESSRIDREDPPSWTPRSLFSGVFSEPVLAVQVFSSWETVSEQVVSESPNHSDLDPRYAPKWTVRVLKRDNVIHALSFNLRQLLSFGNGPAGKVSVLGLVREYYASQGGSDEKEAKAALDRLARPTGISVSIPQIDVLAGNRTLISQSVVSSLLHAIFESQHVDQTGSAGDSFLLTDKSFKSAPFDSLTWRICHVISFISFHYKSKSILAIFWKEIIDELRSRWESGHQLPWIEHSIPDCSCCLLHQKLQMLDCCIRQKIRWEQNSNVSSQEPVESEETSHSSSCNKKKELTASGEHGNDDEGEDEFFDAEDSFDEKEKSERAHQPPSRTDDASGQKHPQPEGRLHQLSDLTLLAHPKEPLFIPVCQDPTPMTDDMLQEQSEVMSKLGTSVEGSALRVKMQLPSLMSDMESFKAANPLASVEDFVRWYSPRDFEDGKLSPRMKAEGNIWIETWNLARPVPARKQKRLFDYTKEAVKVLHFLTNVTLNELVRLMLPVTVHSTCVQLERLFTQALRAPTALADGKGKKSTHQDQSIDCTIKDILHEPISKVAMSSNFNASLNILSDLEGRVFMVESLKKKLLATSFSLAAQSFFSSPQSHSSVASIDWTSMKKLLLDLSTGQEVKVVNEDVRKVLLTLFQSVRRESQYLDAANRRAAAGPMAGARSEERGDNPFLPATTKEFVLHLDLCKPSVHSQVFPQRMYALVSPSEVRFAVTTSEDTSNL